MTEEEKNDLIAKIKDNDQAGLELIFQENPSFLTAFLNASDETCIHFAIKERNQSLTSYLLGKNPDLLESKNYFGETPLLLAVKLCCTPLVNLLLKHKAQILNVKTQRIGNAKEHGRTIIGWARSVNNIVCIVPLLQHQFNEIRTQVSIPPDPEKDSHLVFKVIHDENTEALAWLINVIPFSHYQSFNLLMHCTSSTQIQLILQAKTPWPEMLAPLEYNLIQCAISHHALLLVEELLEQGVNPRQLVNRPDKPDHQRSLIEFASIHTNKDAVNLLIIKLFATATDEEERKTLLSYVNTSLQALDLAARSPDIKRAIQTDPRIMQLIKANPLFLKEGGTIMTYQSRTRSRRNSFFAHIIESTDEITIAFPQTRLGAGSSGEVFSIESPKFDPLVVKKPISDSGYLLQEEADIMTRIYPKKTIHVFNNDVQYRFIMPKMQGVIFSSFISKLDNIESVAALILETAISLNEIHKTGFVHGDVKENNIIVYIGKNKEIKVHFIDFGLTKLSASSITTFKNNVEARYAPERVSETAKTTYQANPNQDVYSLARMIEICMPFRFYMKIRLSRTFPSILNFLEKGKEEQPEARPLLGDFIAALREEIHKEKTLEEVDMSEPGVASCSFSS